MHLKQIFLGSCLFVLFQNATAQDIFISIDSIAVPEVNLEEVVINASKNNSKLKELPVSVTIIPSMVIENNEINTLNQLGSMVPNFSMRDYGSKLTSPVYIRGIGSRINSPSVGLYVDNVPYFEKAAFEFDFFDIESIEVLRGPQGTLYGRNSMGGLINITTKSPANYQGSQVKLSAGNYGSYKLNAGHYHKVNDALMFSLSGNYQHNDGFYTNRFIDKKVDNLDSYGLKNRLIYKVSDKLEFENIAGFENSKQGGYPYAIYNKKEQRMEEISYNQESSYNRILFSDALKFKYTGKNWMLSNTLSYQYLDDAQKIDQDFTAANTYFARQYMKQNMVADEVLLQSKKDEKLSWLIGAFGFLQFSDSDVDVDSYSKDLWYLKTYGLDTKGMALFGQSTYNITNNFSVTGGLRYDYEISELTYTYEETKAGVELSGPDTIYPKLSDNIVLPKLALTYRFNSAHLYVSYSTGYKAGGFNSIFELPEHLMFKNETSYNFEGGVKSPLFKKLLFADVALFYTKLKDQQIYRTAPSGKGSYLENSGLSENKGVELSLKNQPVHGFEGQITYGYTHSKILEYKLNDNLNYNNKYTPYIPRHTFAVQLTKTFNLAKTSFFDRIRINSLYHQSGELYWNLSNLLREERSGMLSANISFIHRSLQLDIWGKNLTNTQFCSFMFEASGNSFAQAGKPRQVGISASVKF